MSAMAEVKKYTPEDLLAMPEGKHYELVDGNLVERDVSGLSSLVAAKITRRLGNHCEPTGFAWVMASDCGYRCFPGDPDKIRRPDVSCILQERLSFERLAEGYVEIAPDLAVEVVSPNDLVYEVIQKIQEYLAAGVKLVWLVIPPARSVEVHRLDGSVLMLTAGDELSGESVLPGFSCRVGDLFPGG